MRVCGIRPRDLLQHCSTLFFYFLSSPQRKRTHVKKKERPFPKVVFPLLFSRICTAHTLTPSTIFSTFSPYCILFFSHFLLPFIPAFSPSLFSIPLHPWPFHSFFFPYIPLYLYTFSTLRGRIFPPANNRTGV